MRFRAFYTSIYNIHLGFIKIESKIGRKEHAKKSSLLRQSGLPRRGIPSPRRTRRGLEYGLGFA